MAEHVERLDVGWYAVIRVVSAQDRAQPLTLRDNRLVPATTHFKSNLLNFCRQTRLHRMTQQKKLPTPRATTTVRQPEKVKSLRCTGLTAFFTPR